jgi:hypothetical protein
LRVGRSTVAPRISAICGDTGNLSANAKCALP